MRKRIATELRLTAFNIFVVSGADLFIRLISHLRHIRIILLASASFLYLTARSAGLELSPVEQLPSGQYH